MCKVYIGYCGTSETEHGLCACTVDNPLAKARGLSLRTGAQTMLYLSLVNLPVLHQFCKGEHHEVLFAPLADVTFKWDPFFRAARGPKAFLLRGPLLERRK